jgi:putative transposase
MLPVMPRTMRVEYPGAIYQVMDRWDPREDIFVDDVDRQDFLQMSAEACHKSSWQMQMHEQ